VSISSTPDRRVFSWLLGKLMVASSNSKTGARAADDRIGEQALADRENREVLYPDETKVGRLILGERAREWPAKAALLEREGLPRVDPLMGGRFWPAVKRWFFNRHGLDVESSGSVKLAAHKRIRIVPFAPDGEVDFDGEKADAARYQRRDRGTRRARSSGR
jgi:hypothetical protein